MDMTPLELSVYKIMAETGLSAQELNQLPMDEWARLTGRPTIGQLAAQAGDFEPPGIPRQPAPQPQETTGTPEPPGIDVSSLDMAEYAQLRQQLGMGQRRKEGVGLLNQTGTQTWVEAARSQPGRSGFQGSNVVESPRIPRPVVRPDVPLDARSVAERFSFPGSAWQG